MRWSFAVVEGAVTVSVVVAVPLAGVTVDGEKLHVAPAGKPEQANETGALNPFAGVTEIVVVTLCPASTVIDGREDDIEKPGEPLVPGEVQN